MRSDDIDGDLVRDENVLFERDGESTDTFDTNVIHVGILVVPDENECSFDVRFLKYVDTLPLLLRANYTRFAREDNVFEKSG